MNKNNVKKFLKKSYVFINNCIKTMLSFVVCILFSSWKAAKIIKNSSKENKKRICFILGNGPSLNEVASTIQETKEIGVFAVNMMANNDLFFKIKPDNYIIADSNFWREEHSVLKKGTKRYEEFQKSKRDFFNNLKKVDWDMKLYIPTNTPLKDCGVISDHIKIIEFNSSFADGFKPIRHFIYNQGLGMPKAVNVVNAAIYCAIMAGYQEINLYGINHSWMIDFRVDDQNRIYTKDTHFYKNPEKERYYFNKGALETSLRSMADAFRSHTMLDIYAKSKGIKIYNCTKHSFVDAYEFKNFAEPANRILEEV